MTTATSMRRQLTGQFAVARAPQDAWRLFTPLGERVWAAHWEPHFPASGVDDDSAPGTVFETDGHDQTATWVVVESVPGRRISYVRIIPNANAATITVDVEDDDGHSNVTVTYDVTALNDAASHHLSEFAARYPAFLQSWEDAIAAGIHGPAASHDRE